MAPEMLYYTVALQNEGQRSAAAEETDPGEGADRPKPTHTTSVQGTPHMDHNNIEVYPSLFVF